MRALSLFFLFVLGGLLNAYAQTNTIGGIVVDGNDMPLGFVNVYIQGTVEGTASGEDGRFSLSVRYKPTDVVTVVASFIGYKQYQVTKEVKLLHDMKIVMQADEKLLDEVVVLAGNYNLKSASTLEGKTSVDLVTTAGSDGDLYKSISLLPGTQVAGTDGRLIVRGGTARETQTYIDGMHVQNPYTASSSNFSSRGRYSPFLFEGINFSMGGYSSEYSQSLSAILPLETKNVSDISKLGIDLMNVSVGGGGTQAWDKGSASFNLNYTDLSLYNRFFYPSVKKYWNKPYRQLGVQHQLRFELGENAFLKTYFAYDKTGFNLKESDLPDFTSRDLDYKEDNVYLNTTFRKKYDTGLQLFAGAAYSFNNKRIDNGLSVGDRVRDKEQELHLKIKSSKRFNELYKLEAGAESYIRDKGLRYVYSEENKVDFNNNIHGFYVSNDFTIKNDLFLNISGRMEYAELNKVWALLPRVALSYTWNKINFSGVLGLYQQSANNDYLMFDNRLDQEKNIQSLIGIYYQENNRMYRVELYNKSYKDLTIFGDNHFSSNGRGYSRGIDVFINDTKFLKYWNYMIAYSFNDTKRSDKDFPVRVRPNYVTAHNLSCTLKYTNYKIKSVIGVSNHLASGRKYHDPTQPGYMNATTPVYNSLDLSYTFLAHKNLIIYASWSNVLNRHNIFDYEYAPKPNGEYVRRAVRLQQNQAFYIGFFLTLGKNAAYDVSNF